MLFLNHMLTPTSTNMATILRKHNAMFALLDKLYALTDSLLDARAAGALLTDRGLPVTSPDCHENARTGIVVASALIIWKTLCLFLFSESPIVVVLSESMSPGFERGELVLFIHSCSQWMVSTHIHFGSHRRSIACGQSIERVKRGYECLNAADENGQLMFHRVSLGILPSSRWRGRRCLPHRRHSPPEHGARAAEEWGNRRLQR